MKSEICTIQPCHRFQYAKGMCQTHYRRMSRHGNPLLVMVPHAPRNSHREWIQTHLNFQSNDCLIWPFAKNKYGYGKSSWNGKPEAAHRVICALVNGPQPIGKWMAAHSCGNGHKGCVNPNHLRWATPKENTADAIAHGTAVRGERQHCAKMTEQKIIEIRRSTNLSRREIAKTYGISKTTVGDILTGKSWKWVRHA